MLTLSQYSFVQQSENVNASTTRRTVRSHAMKAVRRQQRQESAKNFRLKWPEEQSSTKIFQLTWPDKQLPSSRQLQIRQKHIEKVSPHEPVISSTASLERPESANTSGENELFQSGSGTTVNPPPDQADPSDSQEKQSSSQNTIADADEEIPPTSTNIQTLLGAGRINPFQTFPVRADRNISQLIDHCTLPSPSILLTSTRLQLAQSVL